MDVVRPKNAQAPTGNGLKTRPAIVDKKIDSNCQAWSVTSTGFGTKKRKMRPIEIEITKGMILTPCEAGGDAGGGEDEEEAWIDLYDMWGLDRGLSKVKALEGKRENWRMGDGGFDLRDSFEGELGLNWRENWDFELMGRERRDKEEREKEAEEVENEWSARLSIGATCSAMPDCSKKKQGSKWDWENGKRAL